MEIHFHIPQWLLGVFGTLAAIAFIVLAIIVWGLVALARAYASPSIPKNIRHSGDAGKNGTRV